MKNKKALLLFLSVVFVAQSAFADLIDDLAKRAEVSQVRFSPTGEYLTAVKEEDGKRVVAVFTYPDMDLINVIDFPGRSEVGAYWWVNEERILVSVAVDWGNREADSRYGELYAVNADGKKGKYLFGLRGNQSAKTKSRLNQVSREFASASYLHPIWNKRKEILVGIREWSRGYKDVISTARLDVYSGRVTNRLLAPNPNATPIPDFEGNVRFASYIDDDFNSIVYARNDDGDWYEFSKAAYGETQIVPIELAADGRMYVYKSEDGGPRGLYLMDEGGKQFEHLYSHERVDVLGVYRDFKRNIYGAVSVPDYTEQVILDNEHPHAQLMAGLANAFPDAIVSVGSTTHDFRLSVVFVGHPQKTTEMFVYDRERGQLRPLFDLAPWIDDTKLPIDRPIQVTARDGMPLHGYLGLPRGVEAKNLPLVIVPHGGPHGPRDFWGLGFEAIFPAAGYAVLRINYRGSGGYGQAFENAGHGEWAGKMQDDLTDAVRWAIEEGIADPERICISGWSYGGFATVMSLIREPDLYKCGVAGAGVYDQDIQYTNSDFAEDTRWGPKFIDKVIGPTAEDRAAASPITYLDKIKAPLLLIHGEDDRRVPVEHAHELRTAMKKAGKPVPELILFKNEGHSPRKEENVRKWFRSSVEFVEEHIGPGVKAKR